MDPVTAIVVPGFLGGLVIAVLFFWWQRRSAPSSVVLPVRRAPLSTDVINMASIKVAGIGGAGLVAMAAAVALDVPRIGETVALGFVLGVIVAVTLIVRRRRTGSMPSSGRGMGANTTLAIDLQNGPASGDRARDDRQSCPRHRAFTPSPIVGR